MKKKLIKISFVFITGVAVFLGGTVTINAAVTTGLDPESGVATCPAGYGLENFESGIDGYQWGGPAIASTIPGVSFITTAGQDWWTGDWAAGYNGKYPNGAYTSGGQKWAWLGVSQGSGIINFTEGEASYVSVYTSTYSGVVLDAYADDGTFLASSGWASNNISTGKMTMLSISRPTADIGYVIIHDTGNYWLIDWLCTDAPGVPTPVPINQTPVANANGPYIGNEGSSVVFDASGSSDPDGTIVSYEWDLDGDGQYDDATGVNPTFTWGDDYTGNIGLKVTDNGGLTDTDSTTVTVNNVPPIASATNDGPKDEGTPVTVAASQIDPGADTFTYSFDWNNDGIYEIVDQTSPSAQYTFMDNGIYTVGVNVRDDDGGIGTATTDVTVLDLAPTAQFTWTPEPQNEGSVVQFTDQSTSWPDLIISWNWNFGDGGTGTTQNPTHAYGDNGIYTATLTVTDDDGSTDTVSHNVTIVNVAPSVQAGPDQTGNESDTVSFSGSFSDPGWLDTHTYAWDFGDGGTASGTLTPTHVYSDNGIYTVTLTMTDDDGGVGIDTMQVTVNNVAPTVDTGPDVANYSGQTHQLTATFTDPGMLDTHTATIDWGDGSVEAGVVGVGTVTGSHVYFVPGNYTITVTVFDDDGGVGSDSLVKTVAPLPVQIDIKPGSFPNSINLGNKGNVPVGVFTGTYQAISFDATTIDSSSLVFAGAPDLGIGKSPQDLDGDGDLDMVFHFATQKLNLTATSTQATLTGKTTAGIYFEGSDSVRIVPPKQPEQRLPAKSSTMLVKLILKEKDTIRVIHPGKKVKSKLFLVQFENRLFGGFQFKLDRLIC